jgi:cell wall assembly regulator SMI1
MTKFKAEAILLIFIFLFATSCSDRKSSTSNQDIKEAMTMDYRETRTFAKTVEDLQRFLEENYPKVAASFNGPASEEEILELEQLIGHKLPDDVRQLYKIANGQKDLSVPLFVGGYELLTLNRIAQTWQMLNDVYKKGPGWEQSVPQGVVKNRWWHPKWIPFAYMVSGDHLCIDLDPAPGGQAGQVIEFIHDDTWRKHLGLSLNDFLGEFDQGLRKGKYALSKEYDVFVVKKK